MKIIINTAILVIALLVASAPVAKAQSWSQCTDGRSISRCETYDCPKGDTNKDGKCTLEDTDARLTDSRNDSYCANPISGCGQVLYYPSGASEACVVRPQESKSRECDLYALAEPSFTPQPTSSPRATTPTPSPKQTATPTPSATAKSGGDSELPKTGPEHVWLGALVVLLGAAGVYIYEKHKLA